MAAAARDGSPAAAGGGSAPAEGPTASFPAAGPPDAVAFLLEANGTALAHVLASRDEGVRRGVREGLLPALARAGWDVGAAVESLWAGQAPDTTGLDPLSAAFAHALADLARAPLPPLPGPGRPPGPGPGQGPGQGLLPFRLVSNPEAAPSSGVDYARSRAYWEAQPPTVSAMLGGVDATHGPDVRGSLALLEGLGFRAPPAPGSRALDCGAGVGRVACHVLAPRFEAVDLCEADGRFLARAVRDLGRSAGQAFPCALQDLRAQPGAYDLVWVQWVLNYLEDGDAAAFLRRAGGWLKGGGAARVVVKETHAKAGAPDWHDRADASVCRGAERFARVFAAAGLRVVAEAEAEGMPAGLLPVRAWVLVPDEIGSAGADGAPASAPTSAQP